MSEQVRYITNDRGERVGVLLDLEAYHRLTNRLALDAECLNGLSQAELQALAESMLAPAAQAHLDELLARNADGCESLELLHIATGKHHPCPKCG